MTDNDISPLGVPLNIEPSDTQKSRAWYRIRTTKYKYFTPPWPTLARRFEDELEAANEEEILCDAKVIAKADSNSVRNRAAQDHQPPATFNELRERCKNDECCFERSVFPTADFSCSMLPGTNFRHAVLDGANFQNAVLVGADFTGAHLSGANFHGANLSEAKLDDANLRGAKLNGAALRAASLVNADFREATGYEFDSNQSHGLRVAHAKDKWTKLQLTYTNQRLLINLALLAIFLIPFAIKLLCYNAIGVAQERAMASSAVEFLPGADGTSTIALQDGRFVITGTETRTVLQLLFEKQLVTWWDVVVLLISAYNIARGYITLVITPLKEEFIRTSLTPAKSTVIALWRIHIVSAWLVWFAYLPAALLLYQSLTQQVHVPKSLIG